MTRMTANKPKSHHLYFSEEGTSNNEPRCQRTFPKMTPVPNAPRRCGQRRARGPAQGGEASSTPAEPTFEKVAPRAPEAWYLSPAPGEGPGASPPPPGLSKRPLGRRQRLTKGEDFARRAAQQHPRLSNSQLQLRSRKMFRNDTVGLHLFNYCSTAFREDYVCKDFFFFSLKLPTLRTR